MPNVQLTIEILLRISSSICSDKLNTIEGFYIYRVEIETGGNVFQLSLLHVADISLRSGSSGGTNTLTANGALVSSFRFFQSRL